eukprot:TRINITY_DN36074_c0_g1_i1.p1 TRINITY_DN36074_c0_g1~~TRINITY_DN36074_c0_g1_i1.p1  ORF type:complete len:340 (+),score=112.26 TRINITY_DN36074_c0_g1_i1:94-1113(+)
MESPTFTPGKDAQSCSSSSRSADESLGHTEPPRSPLCALGGKDLSDQLRMATRPWNWGKVWIGGAVAAGAAYCAPQRVLEHPDLPVVRDEVLYEVAPAVAAIGLAEVLCYALVRKVWPEHSDPWSLADCFACMPLFIAFVALAASAVADTGATLEDRWTNQPPHGRLFLTLYVAKTLVHLPILWLTDLRPKQRWMMVGHHTLSIVAYFNSVHTGRCAFYACLDGMCEVSTVFLTILYIFKETKSENTFKLLYKLNGFCLWLSFVVFRMALFPYWLYLFASDLQENWEVTWVRGNYIELFLYPFTTVFLLVLSTLWFIPITRGLKKALTGGKDNFKPKDA